MSMEDKLKKLGHSNPSEGLKNIENETKEMGHSIDVKEAEVLRLANDLRDKASDLSWDLGRLADSETVHPNETRDLIRRVDLLDRIVGSIEEFLHGG